MPDSAQQSSNALAGCPSAREFDLLTTSLPPGRSIIEASAGTGKTWTITHLLPRLLLDGTVNEVREILVVSFTEDTARELQERIRFQLKLLVQHSEANSEPSDHEPGVRLLLKELNKLPEVERNRAMVRLRLALYESEHLVVSTIHSFCQQILATESFLCGVPPDFELLPDVSQLKLDAVKDVWRTDIAPDLVLSATAVCGRWTVEQDLYTWGLLNQRPGTRLDPEPSSLSDLRSQLLQSCKHFQSARAELLTLKTIAERQGVNLNQSKANPGQRSVDNLAVWFQQLTECDPTEPQLALFQMAKLIARSETWFSRRGAAGKAAASEVEALNIVRAAQDIQSRIDEAHWVWIAHLKKAADERLTDSLQRLHGVTYDDLISKTHEALYLGSNRHTLRHRLSSRWKVGLIDESQDADQQQLEIFKAIFEQSVDDGRLVMVGDPKQAIYSFRGGDLQAYLRAKGEATIISKLTKTYRSTPRLVQGLNALFGRQHAFGHSSLAYLPATAIRDEQAFPLPTDGQGGVVAWLVPDDAALALRTAERRRSQAASWTGTSIVELLGQPLGNTGEFVQPSNIAVLTRTNLEARQVHEALRLRGVPSVVRDDEDVMKSETATDLACFLSATLSPTHQGWRQAAMATRLFGYNAAMLADLSSVDIQKWLSEFSDWERVWRQRGIAALMTRFESQSGATLRLARGSTGERQLTDLRHLVELLQTREAEEPGSPEKLLHWFENQRASQDVTPEERLHRLDSDGNTVQVSTVHSAKGLEFDFVYCPFLWSAQAPTRRSPNLLVRRDLGWVLINIKQGGQAATRRSAAADNLQEDLRLIYVALTRARRRVTFLAGALGYAGRTPPSALDWLLRSDESIGDLERWHGDFGEQKRLVANCEHADTLNRLQREHPSAITVTEPPLPSATSWTGDPRSSLCIDRRTTPRMRLHAWQFTSFSRLAHGHHQERDRQDSVLVQTLAKDPIEELETNETRVPLAEFVRGTQAGNCLHELLELWDFQDEATPLVEHCLRRHRLYSEEASLAMTQTLGQLRRTYLSGLKVTLQEAASDPALSEWEFRLPVGNMGLTGNRLCELFTRYAESDQEIEYAKTLGLLTGPSVAGMLTGYIDRLVKGCQGWGVIDWKSNYLGPHYSDYDTRAMWRCAAEQHYLLQVHLYLIAVRRYLGRFSQNPESSHISGSLIFLRGVHPDSGLGVLEITPQEKLLTDLDTFFEGTQV